MISLEYLKDELKELEQDGKVDTAKYIVLKSSIQELEQIELQLEYIRFESCKCYRCENENTMLCTYCKHCDNAQDFFKLKQ